MPLSKPPRRRWLQFSLRTFLILLTAFIVFLGWEANQAKKQREAIVALRQVDALGIGGQKLIIYRHEDNNLAHGRAELLLHRVVGPDWFGQVTTIQLTDVQDDDLRHLANLRGLATLDIESSYVTDDGLAHLEGLSSLKVIALCAPKMTGDGLRHLANCQSLEKLYLLDIPVTEEIVVDLKRALPECAISYQLPHDSMVHDR